MLWICEYGYRYKQGEEDKKCYKTGNIAPKAVKSKHLVSVKYMEDSREVTDAYIEQKIIRDYV